MLVLLEKGRKELDRFVKGENKVLVLREKETKALDGIVRGEK